MWIGGDEIEKGVVKIKSFNKSEEYIVNRNERVERVS